MIKHFISIFAVFLFSLFVAGSVQAADVGKLYLFYGDGCPHCAKEEEFLADLKKSAEFKDLEIELLEVWHNQDNAALLGEVGKQLEMKVSGVPVTVIGSQALVGFRSAETSGEEIKALLRSFDGTDVVAAVRSGADVELPDGPEQATITPAQKVQTPLFGDIDLKKLSLPILTVVIGLLDSLNPCAMWVLLFLIGILLGMDNRPKMWLLGWTFIGASAAAYFIFLSAWLNLYQFIKYVSWINWAIAALAVTVGAFNIYDFWVNRNGGCDISGNPTKRKIIIDRIKHFALNRSFPVALVGLAIVGAAVNMVELLCSAGLPAVYVPILTENVSSPIAHYAYLLAYVFFYILIQVVVFLAAMFSLKQIAVSSRITRWFGLASGFLMIAIGTYLVIR